METLSEPFAAEEIQGLDSDILIEDLRDHSQSIDHLSGELLQQDYGYHSSSSSAPNSMDREPDDDDDDDDDLAPLNSRASSRSSISSLPGSVFTYPGVKSPFSPLTSEPLGSHHKEDTPLRSVINSIRERDAAFRKPSSVRAMQMNTEDEDDEYLTPPRRRGLHGGGHRMSDMSMRSVGSSPLKRSPYSAGKQRVKKEYPLVLLHCTLLPPTISIPGYPGTPSQKILREVLPLEYWRRWKLLEEKVGSGVLQDRGVLISHPEDLYDVLEERLLESLELQRPLVHDGHFLGHGKGDSEKEGEDEEDGQGEEDEWEQWHQSRHESATDDEQGEVCPDCRGRVVRNAPGSRKWEVKVYAANGLMRAGAWAAAWKEMEKVDVEVGLWIPSEIRRELEKRVCEESAALHFDEDLRMSQIRDSERAHPLAIEHRPGLTQEHIDGLEDADAFTPQQFSASPEDQYPPQQHSYPVYDRTPAQEIDLGVLLVNYVRVLANDRRNVAIVLLSVLVCVLAMCIRPTVVDMQHPFPLDMPEDAVSTSIFTVTQYRHVTTTTATSVEVALPTSVVQSEMPILPSSPIIEAEPKASGRFVAHPQVEEEEKPGLTPAAEPGSSDEPLTPAMVVVSAQPGVSDVPMDLMEETAPDFIAIPEEESVFSSIADAPSEEESE
ncbi:hypothetical protein ASPZODRAFT_13165 [Penicilliopsis zonata CBS 506.65]|uniref:Flavoprotein oxygenase n=1 Tax=Penicilliopsis zonata CBS 506.65 TaxID=1073090 RepID=A0A1L9SSI1_9EURO|nr:hypothetical protein ASPZODRAFT_13165 [Penicilliopsis zonata CBS 506.65]OJJ50066.1 hypothetical protein ASPZODRAFT_13165 [Penicilliopsis zonata CBS 506.65]